MAKEEAVKKTEAKSSTKEATKKTSAKTDKEKREAPVHGTGVQRVVNKAVFFIFHQSAMEGRPTMEHSKPCSMMRSHIWFCRPEVTAGSHSSKMVIFFLAVPGSCFHSARRVGSSAKPPSICTPSA